MNSLKTAFQVAVIIAVCLCCCSVEAQVSCDESGQLDLSTNTINLYFFLDISNRLDSNCAKIDAKYGMMRLEAFLYALSLVNSNSTLLHGKKIGAVIFDTCRHPNRVFICSVMQLPIVGIVGPEQSETAQIGSVIYTSFTPQISMVSHGATDEYPNHKQDYGNLLHTIPGDAVAYDVLTDIALYFNWTYIAVIHSHNAIANGFGTFGKVSFAKGLCIKFSLTTKKGMDSDYLANLLAPLRSDAAKLDVLYLLLSDAEAKLVVDYLHQNHGAYKHLNLIFGQRVGTRFGVFSDNTSFAVGVLTIEVESQKVPSFEDYYLHLKPENNIQNTYFKRFWEETFNCNLSSNTVSNNINVSDNATTNRCTGEEKLKEGVGFYGDAPVLPVINAVLAFGNAIGAAIVDQCSSLKGANKTACLVSNVTVDSFYTKPQFLESITKILPFVRFQEPTKTGLSFKFDANYRRRTNYNIYNTQLSAAGQLLFKKVGAWEYKNDSLTFKDKLAITESLIRWRNNKIPNGKCSSECAKNQYKIFDRYLLCCWECKTCSKDSIIVNNTCIACQYGTWPDKLLSICNAMPKTGIRMHSAPSIAIVASCCISLIFTLIIAVIYIKHYNRRAIKATNRELSLIVLFGVAVVLMTSMVFLIEPSNIACNVQQCMFGVGFVLLSAPLFLKTLTLYRIVGKSKISTARPKLVKLRPQLLICLSLVGIQFLFAALWVQGNPATVQSFVPSGKAYVITHCRFQGFGLAINFAYPVVLMILAMIFALRTSTNKLPQPASEARFITFTMSLTCLIIFVYLISFSVYSKNKDSTTQEYSISLVYLSVGLINMCSIFIPRIIYLYRPGEEPTYLSTTNMPTAVFSDEAFDVANNSPNRVQVLRAHQLTNEDTPSSTRKQLFTMNIAKRKSNVVNPQENVRRECAVT
eukprot:gene610-1272_t